MKKMLYLFIAIFLLLISIAFLTNVKDYINDSILFIIIILMIYRFKDKLNIGKVSFVFLFIAMLLHNLGVFGVYGKFYWYDILTHIFGLFAVSFSMFFALNKHIKNKTFLVLIVLLTSLGIGSIIENIEYSGYLIGGKGEGLFLYGDGDFEMDIDSAWLDSMEDLASNLVGTVLGILFGFLYKKNYAP